ncbi:hypothetical protein GC169_05110 [bacterium]|nr:hypothetical protein [bacterium]
MTHDRSGPGTPPPRGVARAVAALCMIVLATSGVLALAQSPPQAPPQSPPQSPPAQTSPSRSAAQPSAQPAPQSPAASDDASPDAAQSAPAGMTDPEKAGHIRALMDGALSVDVDADALFAASGAGAGAARLRLLLELVADPDRLAAATEAGRIEGLDENAGALVLAQAEFLSLPSDQRDELLSNHRALREAANAVTAQAATDARTLAALKQQADAIEDFLAGRKTDLALLSINLADPGGIALNAERRALMLQPPAVRAPDASSPPDTQTDPQPEPQPDAGVPATPDATSASDADTAVAAPDLARQIADEQARLDRLRARLLATPAAEQERLIAIQRDAPDDLATVSQANALAEEAARQAALALEEERAAATELQRLFAQERGRLLAVREAQSLFEATLAGRGDPAGALEEETLRLRREARELQEVPRIGANRTAEADVLYARLVEALKTVRQRLGASLSAASADRFDRLKPPALDPSLPPGDSRTQALVADREALIANELRLEGLDAGQRTSERDALYTQMVALNALRLSLIPELSSSNRGAIVGFGNDGAAQAAREVNQIALIARYNLANARQIAERTLQPFLNPTPALVLAFGQIAILALFFRLWRRGGDGPLSRLEAANAERRPATLRSAFIASAVSVYRDVRRPVEWLVLALLIRWSLAGEITFFGETLFWTVAIWLLVAASLVQLADRVARGSFGDDPRAAIRMKSLKLLATVASGVGLTLSITAELVGRGAIHNWVLSTLWAIVPLVALILSNWWRDRIVTLSKAGAGANPVLAWAAKDSPGASGHLARLAAGAVLVVGGVSNFLRRRVKDIAIIRDISEQRSRKQAAAQAAADLASGQYLPLTDAESGALDPHRQPLSPDPETRSPSSRRLPTLAPGKLIALAGERGLGKTTALDDLVRPLDPATVVRFVADAGGYPSVLQALAASAGCAPDEASLAQAFAMRAPAVVLLDDAQRLFMPAIGGIEHFDRVLQLARNLPGDACWVFGVGGPAMTFIGRARSDRALFDEIVWLPRWEPADLRALIERRTAQAGISPVFDLGDDAALGLFDNELPAEERAKIAYFEQLAAESLGNPAIALDIWRRSLFRNAATRAVQVRTFSGPRVADLAALPEAKLFVLRTIVQMEVASAEQIQRCTDLEDSLVKITLRALLRLGVLAPHAHGCRVTLFWYRDVGRLLERNNLLTRIAA